MKKIFILLMACVPFFGLDFKNITSFEADFEQKIANNKKTLSYKGKVYIKEPSNVLWEYAKPQKKVYIKGTSIIVEESALEQVMYSKLENEMSLLTIIETAKKTAQNQYTAQIKNTTYRINTKNNTIDFIQYKDEFENNVTIAFKNQKINHNIADLVFEYEAPKGFDIIRK